MTNMNTAAETVLGLTLADGRTDKRTRNWTPMLRYAEASVNKMI